MAHFAKLGTGNIIERVEVVSNDIAQTEQAGVEFLQNLYKDISAWKQTSYNTRGGEHIMGGTPFRKNYAGIGYIYNQTKDAFIPPKPFNSWILNETTCLWEAPVTYPDDGEKYTWNESTTTWDLTSL
tara:strand:+ start:893 stop:1273 length:381 start_codon:yes stop_codon:yes gene_type:complete